MKKLTLVNAYVLNVKFDFFVYLNYKWNGELDTKNIDLTQVFDLLKNKLKTTKAVHPVVVVGSCWVFPKLEKENKT